MWSGVCGGRGQSVVEPQLTHIFWLERQARLLWLVYGKVALWSSGTTWLLSEECPEGAGHGGGEGYYQHLHVDCTQTNTQRDTQKVHRKSWPECIRFCFMFLFYFIYNIGCCCFFCCCLFWFFVPFWARIRKSFESPLSSAVWMHSWMFFGGAFDFFFNFAFAFV